MLVGFDLSAWNFPDRTWISALLLALDLGFLALDPAEHARLVRPHVNGVRQHWPALYPDDLLMREGADFVPDRFEHRLASTGMPAVPSSVGSDSAFDCGHDESKIEVAAELGVALDVWRWCCFAILARPVLVAIRLAAVRPGRRMGAACVTNGVRWISLEQHRPRFFHEARDVLWACR